MKQLDFVKMLEDAEVSLALRQRAYDESVQLGLDLRKAGLTERAKVEDERRKRLRAALEKAQKLVDELKKVQKPK